MEDLDGNGVASFSDDIDRVVSVLKRESRFFVGTERSEFQRLTDSLEELDNFLGFADEESIEELMRQSVQSWLEETKDEPEVNGYVEEDCVVRLSRLLQQRRIVEFLGGAGQRFSRLKSIRNVFFESESESSEALSVENDPTLLNSTNNAFFESESESSETLSVENDPTMFNSTRNAFFNVESENCEPLLDDQDDLIRFHSGHDRFSDTASGTLSVENEETGQIPMEEATSGTGIAEGQNRKPFYSVLEEFVDYKAKDVTGLLIDGTPTRSVISLVGPSGIGKTVVARKVYDNVIAINLFDFCGWIDVTSSYDMKEVLKAMIRQVTCAGQGDIEGLDGMRMMELLGTLRQSLQSKRYMFVFDDVCREGFWHFIKQGLPDNDNGSRIIVVTPSDAFVDSCEICSFDHVYCLGPLSNAMSQNLFLRSAFQDEPEQLCPLELEQFSIEIVGMCKGFPLPIVAAAGLLSTKDKIVSEWKRIHHNFRLEFKFNLRPPSALDVLTLSFLDLPYHLRSCFLYFSIFPEQSLIPIDKLFKLWIAEGFIAEYYGMTLEEIAKEYLNKLIKINMVQASQDFEGLEKFCQIHRLIHNMARLKAQELNFCLLGNEDNSSYFGKNSLRLSIYNVSDASDMIANSTARSVFLSNIGSLRSSFLVNLVRTCKHLTLLDLEYVPIEYLPEELGNLFDLKYLSLKNTKVKKLPKSLGQLQNLETLDLRNTLLIELPLEINKLKNLQYLLAGVSTRGVKTRQGIGWLEKLHTLTTVDVRRSDIGLTKELAKLRKLRRLGISGLTAEDGIALCTALDALVHLETLTLQAKNDEVLKLQTISTMLTHLKCLVLKGQLPKFPYMIVGLPNLTTLCLSLSKLTDDPLNDLGELPNLVSLWLYRAYEGENLYFEEGGFQRLKLLVLTELNELNVVEIEEGALPCLEEFRIGSSPLLNKVPSGLEHLRSLKVFANYDMPNEFVLSIQPHYLDNWKVMHIPLVTFWYRVKGRSYKMYKLGDSELLDHILVVATNIDAQLIQQPYELELSFCESDDEEVEDDEVDQLSSLSSSRSYFHRYYASQWSFSSGFYTDDVEE